MSTPSTPDYPDNNKFSNAKNIIKAKNELTLKYKEYYTERAAILEYDGGLTRYEANHNARLEALNKFVSCEYLDIVKLFESIIYNE